MLAILCSTQDEHGTVAAPVITPRGAKQGGVGGSQPPLDFGWGG